MKLLRRYRLVLLLAFIALTFTTVFHFEEVLAFGDDLYDRIRVFTRVLDTIQRAYVEDRDPDELLDDAIKGMLSHLDPHTTYLPAKQFDNWSQSFEGYSGIGISFDILRDKITVMSVMEGGPSDRAGLRPGDRIVRINSTPAIGLKRDEVPHRLMGPAGTTVAVDIEREGWAQPHPYDILRDRITLRSIPHSYMIDAETGYVKIERFTGSTPEELDTELHRLEQSGMRRLVLDLRDNSGGYLTAAVEVCDSFLPGGRKIVYTKGRTSSSFQEYYSTDGPTHPYVPTVVLIDHATASASEIVAGALQDWDRALIVGKTSFGKGLVQSQYRFSDGSALLLTTARYYTPSGRLIQRDYAAKSKEEYYAEAYADHETLSWRVAQQPSYKTASGRIVHGGGGITPDVWIEGAQEALPDIVRRILFADERYIYAYVVELATSRPVLRKMGLNEFCSEFAVSDRMFEGFLTMYRQMNGTYSVSQLWRHRGDFKFLIKRELAYVLWGDRGRFFVNMERDVELRDALRCFDRAEALLGRSANAAVPPRMQ